jgi:small conductance mechanosensitive channel
VSLVQAVRASVPFLLALLWLAPAHAQETPSTSQPTAAAGEVREANPLVDRIEALRAEIDKNREEVRATEEDATQAKGADLVALQILAMDKRLDSMEKLRDLVDSVLELEAEGGDVADYRAELTALLLQITPSLQRHYQASSDALSKLREERDAAPPEERVAIEQRITRQNELTGRLLAAGVDLAQMIDQLGIQSPRAREFVTGMTGDRARIISGRIELVTAQLADAEERQSASPDDAAIQSEILALQTRLESDTEALRSTVKLMGELSMDASDYKQLLISSTGEITVDVFDAQVAQGLLAQWADGLRESVVANGPGVLFKSLLFLFVFFAFWMLSRFVRRVAKRAVEAPHLRFSQLLKRMIVSLASGAVLFLGLLVALSQLGIQVGPLLAGLGIAGFIVGFALQETLANFAAGIMILAYRPYDVGDMIDCAGGVFGEVSHMSLVSTTILTIDNQTKIVPNGKIWGDVITNVAAQTERRVDLVFGISYTDDIPKAEAVMESVLNERPKILAHPEPVVKLHELGDSSVNFVVRPWCQSDDYWDVHWDVTREVKMRFDREGISIPFPQRDVHFYPAQANGRLPLGAAGSHMGSEHTAPSGRSGSNSDS